LHDIIGLADVLLKITKQPSSSTLFADSVYAKTTAASGIGALSYQWYKDTTPIANATYSTYSIQTSSTDESGIYTCVIS